MSISPSFFYFVSYKFHECPETFYDIQRESGCLYCFLCAVMKVVWIGADILPAWIREIIVTEYLTGLVHALPMETEFIRQPLLKVDIYKATIRQKYSKLAVNEHRTDNNVRKFYLSYPLQIMD